MIVSVTQLRETLERICRAHGATAEEARLFGDILIEAELRGRPTHGLNRFESIVKHLDRRGPDQPRVVEERGALVRIDGGNASGYLAAAFAADVAARVALREGHALVGMRNTRHSGMIGYYAGRMAEAGVVGMIFADCAPMVAPWGGTQPVLGTNPLAAAFPAKPHPVLIDMSTAAVTYGAIDRLRATGGQLPSGSVLDAQGRPTTDPGAVATILPFGGPKGYALGLLVQLLSGVMAGAAAVPANHEDYGLLILAMKPDLFAPMEQYEEGVCQLAARLKSAAPEGTEVLLPGERAWREREARLTSGIDVPEALWKTIGKLENT